MPRRDRAVEDGRSRNPPVPRAPRAKPRANSCGALSREARKDSANTSLSSISSRTSENRRPHAESPFSYATSGHARVNSLSREKHAVENQVFEMGPRIRSSSLDRREDYQRGHWLAKEHEGYQGMPWTQPQEKDEDVLPKARRRTLHHEHMAADQALEWVPKEAAKLPKDQDSESRCHARVNVCRREMGNAAQTLEMNPMVQVSSLNEASAAVGAQYHGRRNILARETAEESNEAPIAHGYNDAVPNYSRKTQLPPCVPRAPVAAH